MARNTDKFLSLAREAADKLARLDEIRATADAEGRDLSRRERAEVEQMKKDAEELRRRADSFNGGPFDPRRAQGWGVDRPTSDSSDLVLTPEQRMADWIGEQRGSGYATRYASDLDPDSVSLGKIIRGAVTGRWDGADEEHRALVEGTNSAGGFLTPEPLAARFIDRVRASARVMQAGARTIPMTSDTLNIARMTGGAGVAWKNEGAAITPSDMTFDRVAFTARTLPILVKLSRELFEDMEPSAAAGIENEIAQALSLELDRVALRGSGSAPEPRGIRNQSGITVQSLGGNGNTPTWDNVIDGVSNIRALNLEPNAILWSTRTDQTLSKIKLTTGEYTPIPPALSGIARYATNQIPNNLTVGGSGDCSEIYIGDFTQLLVGIRTDLRFDIRVLDQRFADTLEVGLLTYLRADVQLQHPEGFNVMTGVRP